MVTRFIAAPTPRAREAVADAMQAAGVFLFRNTETLVEGERTQERVLALGLPHGDEAIRAELAPLIEKGKDGTQVRVETRRGRNKKGTPKHVWSAAVLDHTACLVSLLSLDDPLTRAKAPPGEGVMIQVPDATPLVVRSRHFSFSTDLKTNQTIPFETAEDVVINGLVVIPTGSFVTAAVEQSKDIGELGQRAIGQIRFKYLVLPEGTRLAIRGTLDLQGKGMNKGFLIGMSLTFGSGPASITGSGFAIPAGTPFQTEVNGQQEVRAGRAVPPPKSVE